MKRKRAIKLIMAIDGNGQRSKSSDTLDAARRVASRYLDIAGIRDIRSNEAIVNYFCLFVFQEALSRGDIAAMQRAVYVRNTLIRAKERKQNAYRH